MPTDSPALNLREWLARCAPEFIRSEAVAACCSRGKRAGRILNSLPSGKGSRVMGVWRCLMLEVSPRRAGMFGMLWADDDERAAYDACRAWLDGDERARQVVALAGGAPLEFGMAHWHLNADAAERLAESVGIHPDALGVSWVRG